MYNIVIQYFIHLTTFTAKTAKSLQSCPTLCDTIDGSPPGSLIPGILQARTLEWVAISFSNAWKWKVKVKSLSRVWLFATLWTAAYQAPPSMGFSRQEYWSGRVVVKYWLYSLCCTVHPCSLFTLYIVVCASYSFSPTLPLPTSLSQLVTTSLISVSVSLFLFFLYSFICFVFQVLHVSDKIAYLPFSDYFH